MTALGNGLTQENETFPPLLAAMSVKGLHHASLMLTCALAKRDSTEYLWITKGCTSRSYQCKRMVGVAVTDYTLVAGAAAPVKIESGPFESRPVHTRHGPCSLVRNLSLRTAPVGVASS